MILRLVRAIACALAVAVATTGCTASSPSAASASVTAPGSVAPAANAVVRFIDQPITLTIQNAVVTDATGTTYTFEVATDPAFLSIVQTKDNIAQGSNGQTSAVLSALAGAKDYYWRGRATAGGTTGPNSVAIKFSIGPAVTVNSPAPIAPLSGASTSPRPTFRVTNATRSGSTGPVTYRFEVATSSSFATLAASGTVNEGVNETGFTPGSDLLPLSATFFWRATATDVPSGVSSNPSTVQSFSTRGFSQAENVAAQLGQTLWPGAVPPGTIGHATMGDDPNFGVGWNIQTLHYVPGNHTFQSPDMEMVRFFDLMDRGYHPVDATAWLKSNGYPTEMLWYPPPEKAVLGLQYVYIASRGKVFVNGTWDVVLRVE